MFTERASGQTSNRGNAMWWAYKHSLPNTPCCQIEGALKSPFLLFFFSFHFTPQITCLEQLRNVHPWVEAHKPKVSKKTGFIHNLVSPTELDKCTGKFAMLVKLGLQSTVSKLYSRVKKKKINFTSMQDAWCVYISSGVHSSTYLNTQSYIQLTYVGNSHGHQRLIHEKRNQL